MSCSNKILARLEHVGVKSNGRWLIRHVGFEISRGEIITIIGPNGSGKSTTLKTLIGTIKPDEGSVNILGEPRLAYVPQAINIDTTIPMSASRMMQVGARHGSKKISEVLEKFHISHLADASLQSLSGGEFQRLMLARAILQEPELLILDEPAQGVDYTGQVEIYDLIRAYRDESGAGVLLVSHDLNLVMAATDRVICMNGHICCSGTPQSVSENPHYRELLGPHASRHLAFYRHSHDHIHLPDGRVQHSDGSITHDCHPEDGHHD